MRWPATLFVDQTGALGGAELCLYDIVTRWQGRCAVVTFDEGPFPERLRAAGVEVISIDVGLSSRKDSGPLGLLGDIGRSVRAAHAVSRLARDFEILSANTQKAAAIVALASLTSGVPFVVQLHDILSAEHFSKSSLSIAARALRRANRVIADSEASRAAWHSLGGDGRKTDVVYYGFDKPSVQPAVHVRSALGVDPDTMLVGHFSRISPWKGQDIFLEAVARVPDVDAILVGAPLFGEEDLLLQLRSLAEQLGISDRAHFLGFREDVSDLMAACDVTVHSSTASEPFGRVIVESMLVGTPVIAADSGGPQEIICSGVDGWLTSPGEASELAATLTAVANNRDQCVAFGTAAKNSAERRFGMDRYLEQIREIHEAAAELA